MPTHPYELAKNWRQSGATFREIAKKLNDHGYLTVTRRRFGQGSAHNLMSVGAKAEFQMAKEGEPIMPPKKRKNFTGKVALRHRSLAQLTTESNLTQMILDVATSNIAEPTKTKVIALLARSL